MRKVPTWMAIVGLLAVPVPLAAQEAANDTGGSSRAVTPEASAEFARTAAVSGMFEIEASRIALQRSANSAVKEFAEMMIADHTKAGEELKAAAGKLNLPSELDPPHRQLIDMLTKSGADFDRLYIEQQNAAHKEAISLFTAYATTGPNGSLKGFAAKVLPTLRHHQEMVGAPKAG